MMDLSKNWNELPSRVQATECAGREKWTDRLALILNRLGKFLSSSFAAQRFPAGSRSRDKIPAISRWILTVSSVRRLQR